MNFNARMIFYVETPQLRRILTPTDKENFLNFFEIDPLKKTSVQKFIQVHLSVIYRSFIGQLSVNDKQAPTKP